MRPTVRTCLSWLVFLLLVAGCAGPTTTAKEPVPPAAPPAAPPTAPKEGAKARLSVLRMDVTATTAPAAVGTGLADMLAAALAQSNRFAITSRDADLIVVGVVTEFAPAGRAPGQPAQVTIEMGLLDAKTSQVFASGKARGSAGDTAGLDPGRQPPLGAALAPHAGTPLEKAIRAAIQNAAQLVMTGTPVAYYRHAETAAGPPAATHRRSAGRARAPVAGPAPRAGARTRLGGHAAIRVGADAATRVGGDAATRVGGDAATRVGGDAASGCPRAGNPVCEGANGQPA